MMEPPEAGPGPGAPSESGRDSGPDSATRLLKLAQGGDQAALDALFTRFLPPLKRWATGRLPVWARALIDTDDLLQETFYRTVHRVDVMETRTDFQAYLRQAVLNRIRDEIRKARKARSVSSLDGTELDDSPNQLEELLGREALEQYDAALERLSPEQKEAVVGRVEMGLTYQELAEMIGKTSPDAARMVVSRALLRLAKEMSSNG